MKELKTIVAEATELVTKRNEAEKQLNSCIISMGEKVAKFLAITGKEESGFIIRMKEKPFAKSIAMYKNDDDEEGKFYLLVIDKYGVNDMTVDKRGDYIKAHNHTYEEIASMNLKQKSAIIDKILIGMENVNLLISCELNLANCYISRLTD